MPRNLEDVSTKRQRIATVAEREAKVAFTSLAHNMDLNWLYEAHRQVRKNRACGVDAVTSEAYRQNLDENLRDLLERLKQGRYKAPPVRRTEIPKGTDGETRPIGIPTFEDKIVQRAVVMLLEPIYEHDFHDFSYGYRPKRSAHKALEDVWQTTMAVGGGWVLEVDLRKFFDTLDHKQLQELVSQRVRDGALRRLIGKWLKAGVMSEGNVYHPEDGTPQGGVISPLLANIYLHYVLDEWFVKDVRPRLRGRGRLIRYADDFVIIFEYEDDARRVLDVLPKRMAKYGLTIHPDKTRLTDFRSPNHRERRGGKPPRAGGHPDGKPGTFGLLGFTHYWRKSRKGNWVVGRKTKSKRLARALQDINQWCRKHRHKPVRAQWETLCAKLRGHYGYYGLSSNRRALDAYRTGTRRAWRKWLSRRNRNRSFNWTKYTQMAKRYPLPLPSKHRVLYGGHGRIPAQQTMF